MKSRLLSIISLIVGVVLFIYLLKQTGTSEVIQRVRALGFGFLLILGISAIRQLARGYAWLRCMSDDSRRVGLLTILRARLAGDAMADLTAAGPVIGEPIKLTHLKGRVSLTDAASSLAVESFAYTISVCWMVMVGTMTLLTFFTVGESLRIASILTLLFVSCLLLGGGVILKRRLRIVSRLITAVFAPFNRDYNKLHRVHELENYVFDFYARRHADFIIVACCELAFHFAGIIEIYATLRLIDAPTSWLIALILEGVNRVLNVVFAFVPALIGIDEAGTGLLTDALGLGTITGVTLAIIRKARMLVWIALGLLFLARPQSEMNNRL